MRIAILAGFTVVQYEGGFVESWYKTSPIFPGKVYGKSAITFPNGLTIIFPTSGWLTEETIPNDLSDWLWFVESTCKYL